MVDHLPPMHPPRTHLCTNARSILIPRRSTLRTFSIPLDVGERGAKFVCRFCPSGNWPSETGTAIYHNYNPNKCIDVRGNVLANGTPVQIYDCNGSAAQKWVIQSGSTKVRLANTNFCLDAGSTPGNGVQMKIWQCYDNLAAQQWYFTPDNRIALEGQGQCLDLPSGNEANSQVLQTWTSVPSSQHSSKLVSIWASQRKHLALTALGRRLTERAYGDPAAMNHHNTFPLSNSDRNGDTIRETTNTPQELRADSLSGSSSLPRPPSNPFATRDEDYSNSEDGLSEAIPMGRYRSESHSGEGPAVEYTPLVSTSCSSSIIRLLAFRSCDSSSDPCEPREPLLIACVAWGNPRAIWNPASSSAIMTSPEKETRSDLVEKLDDSFRDDGSGDVEERLKVTSVEAREAEQALVRKLDWRILPITCLLYLFAYLDRSNLGNARLQGLPEDVLGGDPTGKRFDWIVSVFYISYIVCQIPAVITSKLFPPRLWMAFAAMGWGISSTLMATSLNFAGLVVCRLAIGVFEAGFGPAIPLYFSLFYTKAEMGLRMAYWFGFAAVAGAFGGLIAFGVQHAEVSFPKWKLLFIVEGLPSFLLGVAALWVLPDRPESTTVLSERERKIALERMNRATRADVGLTVNSKHIFLAFKDWRIYTCGVVYFGLNTALASISAFLPTIITTFGHSNAVSQLLTVPPYATAAVVLILFARTSDIRQSRGVFMVIACTLSGLGYLILLLSHSSMASRYFATFCITSGTYTTIGLVIAWFSHNLGSETKKATGIPMFMAIGQCGSILGSHIFPKSEGPDYTRGFAICCALAFLSAICSGILSVSYRIENAWKEEKYGKVDPDAPVDTRELADKAPNFRYVP
ncbi:hypothetical protein NMY22_g15336 [Coprinellus aureogranulatus]|nr:hypothetical protein NMY22_g15336 [Coprinellus aureogranulatus]